MLVAAVCTRTYPYFKQCDPTWANNPLGTGNSTICKSGGLVTCAAMALNGATAHKVNPATLNAWLKQNKGYTLGDHFVWASINTLGLIFEGKVDNSQIKPNLDKGKVVIVNEHSGGNWALANSYNGDNIIVNDPYYNTTTYSLSAIVNGNTGIYRLG